MKTGEIYFLRRQDGLIKVGYSASLKLRMEQLTKSHGPLEIVRVINGDQRREKRLHSSLARFHEFGEWFRDGPELRACITALDVGSVMDLATTDAERMWLRGEAEAMAEAKAIIDRLLISRRAWADCNNNDDAFKALAVDYGIKEWMLKNIHCRRAIVVSAHAMKVLTCALPVELLRHRDHLLAALEAVGAGRSAA